VENVAANFTHNGFDNNTNIGYNLLAIMLYRSVSIGTRLPFYERGFEGS
jgi:hypothetical protein